MSNLDELIQKLCPNGVEFKKLEECCKILDNQRKPVTKSARTSGNYPYYGANGIQDYVSEYIFQGMFVLVGEDGSVIDSNGKPIVTWAEGKIWVNNHAHVVEEKKGTLLRYLYYYLQTINISSLIHGNIPKLNQGDFRKLLIPVPPIEVQNEIVRILDNFTKLTEELTEELADRKKQYEYYRDKLLNFETTQESLDTVHTHTHTHTHTHGYLLEDIKWIKIKEVSKKVSTGNNNNRNKNGIYPVYGSTGIISYTNQYVYDKTQILIARVGANAGRVNIVEGKYDVSDNTIIIEMNESYNIKFLYYYLQSYKINRIAKGGGQPLITSSQIKDISIPKIKVSEQERIVSILDRFDKLCNDISEGLPAEIEARKKQYEYYRDKLLTFKEVGNNG